MPTAYKIQVRVTPRASKNELRFDGDVLNVRVTAAPVDGSANSACCALIADALNIARSRVTVVRGQKSRVKTVLVDPFEGCWPWSGSTGS
jgi:uncharacterized protein YggU (UPF0235/DUF167 family)